MTRAITAKRIGGPDFAKLVRWKLQQVRSEKGTQFTGALAKGEMATASLSLIPVTVNAQTGLAESLSDLVKRGVRRIVIKKVTVWSKQTLQLRLHFFGTGDFTSPNLNTDQYLGAVDADLTKYGVGLPGASPILKEHAEMRFYSQSSWGNLDDQNPNTPELLLNCGDIQTLAPSTTHDVSEIWLASDGYGNLESVIAQTRLVLRTVPAAEEWQDPDLPLSKTLNNTVWPMLAVSGYGENTGERPVVSSPGLGDFLASARWFRFRFIPAVALSAGSVYAFNPYVEGTSPDPSGAVWFALMDDYGVYYGYYKFQGSLYGVPSTTWRSYGQGSLAFQVYEPSSMRYLALPVSFPYTDLDRLSQLHIALENLSPTAKLAGADGEVVIQVDYEYAA